MTTLREAAQAALDALEQLQGGCTDHDDGTVEALTVWCPEVINDLRAALLAERAHWKAEAESWEKQASDRVDDALKFAAERDALKAENASIRTLMDCYNLGGWTDSLRLMQERDALAREVDACAAALPGPYYMDPPDGGDVSISEQLRRMARDAARYRKFVVSGGWHRHIDGEHPEESYSYLLVGLPVDADLSCYATRKLVMDKVLDEGSER